MSAAPSSSVPPFGMPRAILSDIDGTLVHYEPSLNKLGYTLLHTTSSESSSSSAVCQFQHKESGKIIDCLIVPSQTLGRGFITCATLQLVELLRNEFGVVFVIMTGARTSTLCIRRDSRTIPTSDYDVCENGGKVFKNKYNQTTSNFLNCNEEGKGKDLVAAKKPSCYNISESGSANQDALIARGKCSLATVPSEIVPDPIWCQHFVHVTGNWEENNQCSDATQRKGPLWDCFRELSQTSLGAPNFYKLDARDFSTSFIIDFREATKLDPQNAEKHLRNKFQNEFESKYGVQLFVNLGKGHVVAKGCSKRTAAEHIVSSECGIPKKESEGPHEEEEEEKKKTSNDEEHVKRKKGEKKTIQKDNNDNNNGLIGLRQFMYQHCIALFDDDNDLDFAMQCGRGMIPTVAHQGVLDQLRTNEENANQKKTAEIKDSLKKEEDDFGPSSPSFLNFVPQWKRPKFDGLLGTEEALRQIVTWCEEMRRKEEGEK